MGEGIKMGGSSGVPSRGTDAMLPVADGETIKVGDLVYLTQKADERRSSVYFYDYSSSFMHLGGDLFLYKSEYISDGVGLKITIMSAADGVEKKGSDLLLATSGSCYIEHTLYLSPTKFVLYTYEQSAGKMYVCQVNSDLSITLLSQQSTVLRSSDGIIDDYTVVMLDTNYTTRVTNFVIIGIDKSTYVPFIRSTTAFYDGGSAGYTWYQTRMGTIKEGQQYAMAGELKPTSGYNYKYIDAGITLDSSYNPMFYMSTPFDVLNSIEGFYSLPTGLYGSGPLGFMKITLDESNKVKRADHMTPMPSATYGRSTEKLSGNVVGSIFYGVTNNDGTSSFVVVSALHTSRGFITLGIRSKVLTGTAVISGPGGYKVNNGDVIFIYRQSSQYTILRMSGTPYVSKCKEGSDVPLGIALQSGAAGSSVKVRLWVEGVV